jgi:predicted SnoaL-like aldol condensation-catalyzing enzyme
MSTPDSSSQLRIDAAARTWAATWAASWPRKDRGAIADLYSQSASYRALAFREPGHGLAGVKHYLDVVFGEEADVECSFGEPIVNGDRAAVQWWASWTEADQPLTMAGVTILRFDDEGKVVEHRDYWNQTDGRARPYQGW